MTKKELDEAVAKLEALNRTYQSEASLEIRKLYRQALQDMLNGKTFDEEAINAAITEIYKNTVYKAADKIETLQYKYYTDALIRGKYTQDLNLPNIFYGIDNSGEIINLDTFIMPVAHRFKLSGNVWGADEVKSRALAVTDYCRSQGMSLKDTGRMMDELCTPNGGKKIAKKIDRLYSVKSASGNVIEERWKEGWMRDWAHENGIEFDKHPDSEFMKRFKAEGGQAWIDTHSVGKNERRLLPKVHKDFVQALGKESIDYRSARLIRTEAQSSFNSYMEDFGESNGGTGKYEIILAPSRDAQHCDCKEFAAWSKSGKTKQEIEEHCGRMPPFHPNCSCWAKALFPTQEELLDKMKRM